MAERLSPRLHQLPNPRVSPEGSIARERILGNLNLPIAAHRDEIEAAIRNNSVSIIVAPTGSGKTTQVPQYAREMFEGDTALFDEIIVTQPRILAARSVSERIASEIAEAGSPDSVGYYTGKEGTDAPQRQQNIALLTDGKAWRQMMHEQRDPDSTKKRLLIIDEAHENNTEIAMLIALAHERTNPHSPEYDPNLKVVIMSATMNSERLRDHFEHIEPPIINVEVSTHEVTHSVSDKPVAEVALELAIKHGKKVLVFLPGKREIAKLAEEIANKQTRAGIRMAERIPVIPLHGQQNAAEQALAFADYPNGAIIAATNAAETSLTVPDVVAVVDSGLVRIDGVTYEIVETGSDTLTLKAASQASLRQRAGRTGRTEPGEYVLCLPPDSKMPPVPINARPEYETPAIQRSALDGLLLSLKTVGRDFSSLPFLDKPSFRAVEAAQKRLFVLGAIDKDGHITERGIEMESLPLDPEFACMIAFARERGYNEKVQQNILDIVAIMQQGGILKRAPKEQRWRGLLERDIYGDVKEKDSDYIVQLEAYVKLRNDVDVKDWGRYDILEHPASLVERDRATLAGKLGVGIHEPALVEQDNRQAVLTCITAGQLNQLWRRNGEEWSLVGGNGEQYSLAKASVVKLGQFATAKMFSLGLGNKTYQNIQDANHIPHLDLLEQAAAHLITDVEDPYSARFDPRRKRFVAKVTRTFGGQALRSFERPIDAADAVSVVEARLSQESRESAWNEFVASKYPPITYDAGNIDAAIENPASVEYGRDEMTDEPLIAWMGGKGKWCLSREFAVTSLLACRDRIENAPSVAGKKAAKARMRDIETKLRALTQEYPALVYTPATIGAALDNPDSVVYGSDPITGEPLIAYMGGDAKWCASREIAVTSLEACRDRMERAPSVARDKVKKADILAANTELRKKNRSVHTTKIELRTKIRKLSNTPEDRLVAAVVKKLLSSKPETDEDRKMWLAQARAVLL